MPLIAGLPWHEVHAAGRSMGTMIGSFAQTGTPSDEAGRPWPPADRPRRLPRYADSRTGLTAARSALGCAPVGPGRALHRSEEHTSDLQSLMRNSYAVFCLKNKRQPT